MDNELFQTLDLEVVKSAFQYQKGYLKKEYIFDKK